MSLGYEITVRRTRLVSKDIGHKWEKITANSASSMAYSPEHICLAEEQEEIYSQVVDDLDLTKVIEAVNAGGRCTREEGAVLADYKRNVIREYVLDQQRATKNNEN